MFASLRVDYVCVRRQDRTFILCSFHDTQCLMNVLLVFCALDMEKHLCIEICDSISVGPSQERKD